MADIEIKCGDDPKVHADLIKSTLHGHVPPHVPETDVLATVGKLVREEQEEVERRRPSRQQIETVDFAKLDDEQDWTDV